MFSYYACGLGIKSTLLLPELVEGGSQVDVVIRQGELGLMPESFDEDGIGFHAANGDVHLFWKGIATFLVRGGREIVIDAAPGVDEQLLRLLVLGRVLGTLLHQRGLLVLHASAIAADGGAIAFLGGKGYGKSTTARAMYEWGHAIVADDLVAVEVDAAPLPKVFPGFPQLKLWPEAAASLGDAAETLPRLHPNFEKRARRAVRGFSCEALPLKRIYVLAEGEDYRIEPLHPQEAFMELVRHSYAVRLLGATGTASRHFRQCERLLNSVSVCRLRRIPSLSTLPEMVKIVEEDLA